MRLYQGRRRYLHAKLCVPLDMRLLCRYDTVLVSVRGVKARKLIEGRAVHLSRVLLRRIEGVMDVSRDSVR